MEQHGILRSWDNHKGFGFIRSDKNDYFVHISSVQGEQRPQQGEILYFAASQDQYGRLCAQHVRSSEQCTDQAVTRHTPQPASTTKTLTQRRQSPTRLTATLCVLTAACALPALGSWQAFSNGAAGAALWPLLLYMLMSVFSVLQYWCDKHNAQRGQWRIPERHLHTVALLGGWPGALIAQKLMRHKTQKTVFQSVFWLIVLAHQVYWLDQLGLTGQLLQQLRNTV